MIGGVSGLSFYYNPYQSGGAYAARPSEQSQNAQRTAGVWTARKAASPETPVEPVRPARAISPNEAGSARLGLPVRQGADPVEMAVRMRIQYGEPTPEDSRQTAGAKQAEDSRLPEGALPTAEENGEPAAGVESAQKALEEGECQTCKERKYQDGSDDPGVSFKTPTNIAPEQAASAVRGHEMEHVVREQAKAQREDREVVRQTVTLHTAICPECGKAYVSGGTTETTTVAKADNEARQQDAAQKQNETRTPFAAVA